MMSWLRRQPPPQIAAGDYQRSGDQPGGLDYIENVGGVDWFFAPVPPRRHQCWPQTRAFLNGEHLERCPCGGIRMPPFPGWLERNTSRPRRTVAEQARMEAEQQRQAGWRKLMDEYDAAEQVLDRPRMDAIRGRLMELYP
jgi:hypothetical protein